MIYLNLTRHLLDANKAWFHPSITTVLVMTREKKVRFAGKTLLYGRIMGEISDRRHKCLGIIEADLINEKEMKKKFKRVKTKAETNVEIKIELKE